MPRLAATLGLAPGSMLTALARASSMPTGIDGAPASAAVWVLACSFPLAILCAALPVGRLRLLVGVFVFVFGRGLERSTFGCRGAGTSIEDGAELFVMAQQRRRRRRELDAAQVLKAGVHTSMLLELGLPAALGDLPPRAGRGGDVGDKGL